MVYEMEQAAFISDIDFCLTQLCVCVPSHATSVHKTV